MSKIDRLFDCRWEDGIDHHSISYNIISFMEALEIETGEYLVDIRTGGDGDNGESMMYLMDPLWEKLEEYDPKLSSRLLIFLKSECVKARKILKYNN